tara:strand:- start:6856 stop:7224 length:369 start_codon:yes stop_codon:yes gene_type:complete
MLNLLDISGQKFYYSTIEEVIESCSQNENCAIIIDENYLEEFLVNGNDIIGPNINQIIIISDSVNTVLSKLEGVSVLLLAAVSLKDAVRLAILGEALSSVVVCVPKEDKESVIKILSEVAGK